MKNDRRTFFLYDLEISARKVGASLPTMTDVASVWQKMRVAGQTFSISSGTGTMLIGDFALDTVNQHLSMLIRLSDKSAPNSVYSDPAAGNFTEHLKIGNIGADFACHVLISMVPEAGQPNVYTCAVEKVAGLNTGLIRRALSNLLRVEYHQNANFFTYPAPGGGVTAAGTPRIDRCCPHIEMRGRPSKRLIDDVNTGRLSGVSLIKAEAVTPIAGAPYLSKKKTELKLAIDYNNLPANLWASLEQTMRQHSGTYGQAKIAYIRPGSRRFVTVEIDAATGEPLNEMFVESFEIGPVFPPLAQSAAGLVPRLLDPAIVEALKHRTP